MAAAARRAATATAASLKTCFIASSSCGDYSRPPPLKCVPSCSTFFRSDLVAGVAGAGTMGRGIAQVLAQCGARTLLFDAQPGAARKGKESIAAALGKLAEKGRLPAADVAGDAQPHRGRRVGSRRFAPCHVVVEAIIEELGAKRELFASLEKRGRPRLHPRLQHLVALRHGDGRGAASAPGASPATTSSIRCR